MDYNQEFATKFGLPYPNPIVRQRKKEKLALASVQPTTNTPDFDIESAGDRLRSNPDIIRRIGEKLGGSQHNWQNHIYYKKYNKYKKKYLSLRNDKKSKLNLYK